MYDHLNVRLHGPLYVKARTALDTKMQASSKAGKKSSRKPCKTLEPEEIRTIYIKSSDQIPKHITQCAFIGLGISRAARANAEWVDETVSDLQPVMDASGEIEKFIFNPQYSKTYNGGLDSIGHERDPTEIKRQPEVENQKLTHFFWIDLFWKMLPDEMKSKPDAKLWWQCKPEIDANGVGFYSNPKKVAGKETIKMMVSSAAHRCGISGHITNKSLRQVPTTLLFGVSFDQIDSAEIFKSIQ